VDLMASSFPTAWLIKKKGLTPQPAGVNDDTWYTSPD